MQNWKDPLPPVRPLENRKRRAYPVDFGIGKLSRYQAVVCCYVAIIVFIAKAPEQTLAFQEKTTTSEGHHQLNATTVERLRFRIIRRCDALLRFHTHSQLSFNFGSRQESSDRETGRHTRYHKNVFSG